MFNIESQLKLLPDNPGVYLMKDKYDNIIYVGKAVVLKNRVKQYFKSSANHSPKVRSMVSNIASFEYIITDNELEALILECNLIKKYKPKYNILLRDDKTYPYIKVTVGEEYPRLLKVRKISNDKAKYFGPYTNISSVNATLNILNKIYPIRNCNIDIQKAIKNKIRPCLEYYIKNCVGPCTGCISEKEYSIYIDEILKFLNGKSENIINLLNDKMRQAASEQRYEDAALYRDAVKSINDTLISQKITSADKKDNRDVIAIAVDGDIACIEVFFVRNGRILGRENFTLDGAYSESISNIILNFLKQFYSEQKYIPSEILVEEINDEISRLETYFAGITNHKVKILQPKRGEKYELLQLVKKNAFEYLNKFILSKKNNTKVNMYNLEELKRVLALDTLPHRIEAYDISNIQGVDSVGAMVVFTEGKRDRHEYRRYRVKTVEGSNDVGSMAEVIERRIKYGNYPDLVLVDGGINQVNAVKNIFDKYGLGIEVWGMFKDDRHRTDGLINEECHFKLDRSTSLYRFVASIQEEVHNYAVNYHRSLRENKFTKSILDEIEGIGSVKRKRLISRFKTIENIRDASISELLEIDGINEKLANNIKKHLEKWGKNE